MKEQESWASLLLHFSKLFQNRVENEQQFQKHDKVIEENSRASGITEM